MLDVKYNQKTGSLEFMEFEDEVKEIGNSGRLILPVGLVGKKVRVRLNVL